MVESTDKDQQFKDGVSSFSDTLNSAFGKLKSILPEEQLKKAEERIPEMHALKSKCAEKIE